MQTLVLMIVTIVSLGLIGAIYNGGYNDGFKAGKKAQRAADEKARRALARGDLPLSHGSAGLCDCDLHEQARATLFEANYQVPPCRN